MQLPTEVFGDVVVAHAGDELAGPGAGEVANFLGQLDPPRVVLDIDALEIVDSQGLEALLDAKENLVERGGDLRITTTNKVNRTLLRITRLDEHLAVFDSLIDAVKSYQGFVVSPSRDSTAAGTTR